MSTVMSSLQIPIKQLDNARGLALPSYATEHSAGMDLLASIDTDQTLQPGEYAVIPAGISIALPVGFEAQVRPRSGLAAKHGIGVLNAPGTIDADYRGEIGVILINHGKQPFVIERGMRIAQMVIAPYTHIQWDETVSLEDSVRGEGGFGSTGISAGIKETGTC